MEIAEIYKGTKLYQIVDTNAEKGYKDIHLPAVFNGMAVLYEPIAGADISADMLAYLNKIIEGGMKVDPAQTLVVNLAAYDLTLQQLAEHIKAKRVVIFGTRWATGLLNTQLVKNELVHFYGMRVLITDTVDVIQSNETAKKQFWSELKALLSRD